MLKGLLAQWRAVSFEKKLTAFVAPILVGIFLLVVGRMFPEAPAAQPPPVAGGAPSRVAEQLEIVRVAVADAEYDGDKVGLGPAIDVTLRNLGETVAIITDAQVEVIDDARIKHCQSVTGGPLGVSFKYSVAVPPDPEAHETFAAQLSQSIAPNEADRIAIALDVPEFSWDFDNAALYALKVVLFHGPDREPVPVGAAVVAFPGVPGQDVFPGWYANDSIDPELAACLEENEDAFRRFLAIEGVKPEGFDERVLADKELVLLGTADQYAEFAAAEGLSCTEQPDELLCSEDGPLRREFRVTTRPDSPDVDLLQASSASLSNEVLPYFAELAAIATGTSEAEEWVLQSTPAMWNDPDDSTRAFNGIDVNFWEGTDEDGMLTVLAP